MLDSESRQRQGTKDVRVFTFLVKLEEIMNQRKSLIAASVFGLMLSIALPGCVVVPDQGHYAGGVVMVAPPAPRVEIIGTAPYSGYVWVGGYWNWVGGRHVWVSGHYVAPRRGYHWVDHAWVRAGDGWRMRPGHWERG
jgi:YXWGXW repeat-containing protein